MTLCNIYNSAAHYRRAIFRAMDKAFDCAWTFGEKPIGGKDIKSVEPSEFKNFLGYLKNRRIAGNWYWQRGVLRLLFKKFDTYLVLGEPYCLSTWVFCILAKFIPGKRVFFWSHGWYGRENLAKKILKKAFFRLGNGIFLYGNYARGLMIKEGFAPEKLFVIHNSLDYDEQLKLRQTIRASDIFRRHFGNADKTLIFVGRLTRIKHLDMVLPAMAILRSRGENYNFVLVGDGQECEALKEKTQKLGLTEHVWFYGACYDEATLAELIFNADLCVAPGNIGLTAIHALSFGCPCLTHGDFPNQMPEFEAIVPGKTGAFFERGNVNSLADAISTWFSEMPSRESVREACYAEIDSSWNPQFQISILKEGMK